MMQMLTTLTQQFQLQLEQNQKQLEHNKKLEHRIDQLQIQNQNLQESLDEFKEKTTTTTMFVKGEASVFDDRWPFDKIKGAGDQRIYVDPNDVEHYFHLAIMISYLVQSGVRHFGYSETTASVSANLASFFVNTRGSMDTINLSRAVSYQAGSRFGLWAEKGLMRSLELQNKETVELSVHIYS